ncbi:flagellar biosynthesis protein FlgD [Trinickia dabaoshanensis]|uniref:Basal-body rod modification protein FlgD n=1 Tax=Trinickia dabaoshanensis TaxID=564714 RepID=A0A2N7VZB3_9BURK|nr:flagellar hook assembly protein FlgD [Trinickia dabaoshanensis]PMS22492.1 flagellar biosynthesis protein FlgD [Trinickia dabaoshanensis]
MTSSNTTIGSGGTVSQQLLDTINGTSSNSSSSASSSNSSTSLQTTFLKLLVTQLQNQDPSNPMDSSQMTSQLAQINTVTGISQLNTTLTSLASQLSAGQSAQASLLIGQNVLVPAGATGATTTVGNGASTGFGVSLSSAVSDLKVTVKDKSGNIVNTLDLGAQQAGTVPVTWKPVDSSGNTLPDGTYSISAAGTGGTGATAAVTALTGAQVQSVVQQSDGSTGLMLNNGTTVGMTSVTAIL